MPAAMWKMHIEQGATWRTILTVKDSTGVPVDLTGYAARMQVREPLEYATPLISLTSPSGGITVDGPAGKLTLLLADSATAALSWTYAVYDVEIESPSGETARILKGEIEVSPEVTR